MVLVFWRILSMKGFEKWHFSESGGDNKAKGSGTGGRIVTFRPVSSPSLETKGDPPDFKGGSIQVPSPNPSQSEVIK
jgi:hypothetical protein